MGALFWILSHTPLKLAWALGWACAWLWWTIIPFRRSLAINGYHRAFPDRPPGADLRRMFAGLVKVFSAYSRCVLGITKRSS